MSEYKIIYLLVVGILGPIVILIINKLIKRTEGKRTANIKKKKTIAAVDTSSPLDNLLKETKEYAIETISNRFSIIKNVSLVFLIIVWIIILIIPFLNMIPATIVSVIVGAGAIILGIAAKPIIENIISGILITFSKPFRVGDTVMMDGNYGTIEDITLTYTIIKIWDWRRYVIPNSQMMSKEFVNYTLNDNYIWVRVEFMVSYETNLKQLKELATSAAKKSSYFVNYEEPGFWVMSLEQHFYKCWVAAWSNSPANAWELGNDIRSQLLISFQEHKILSHDFVIKNH